MRLPPVCLPREREATMRRCMTSWRLRSHCPCSSRGSHGASVPGGGRAAHFAVRRVTRSRRAAPRREPCLGTRTTRRCRLPSVGTPPPHARPQSRHRPTGGARPARPRTGLGRRSSDGRTLGWAGAVLGRPPAPHAAPCLRRALRPHCCRSPKGSACAARTPPPVHRSPQVSAAVIRRPTPPLSAATAPAARPSADRLRAREAASGRAPARGPTTSRRWTASSPRAR